MGYYVVVSNNTHSDIFITGSLDEAQAFKYNYEYSNYGSLCSIKHIEHGMLEFPKALYVDSGAYYQVDSMSNEIIDGYHWIYNYCAPNKPVDEYLLSKKDIAIIRLNHGTEKCKPIADGSITIYPIGYRYNLEFYIKTRVGESVNELRTRIKKHIEDIILTDLKESLREGGDV